MTDIRPATAADVPVVKAIVDAAYQHYVPRIGRRPAPMTADYDELVRQGSVWVATDDGATVGLIVIVSHLDHLLLENIAVMPAAQGRGVGHRLLDFVEEEARRRRHDEVRLYTHEAMVENLAYYARHGYVETHRAQEDGFQRVFLSKRLP